MPTNGYCAVADVKSSLQITDTNDDALLDTIVGAVSRWVDGYCGQSFYQVTNTRTFVALNRYAIDVDGIASAVGLVVKSDDNGDGVFENTWNASDYELLPYNAFTATSEPVPYTQLRAVGTRLFPLPYTVIARRDRVQVTATWGWPAIPVAVKQATIMQAARLFKRRYSPEGVAGFGDFGAVRVSSLDVDVARLLDAYRVGTTTVAFA